MIYAGWQRHHQETIRLGCKEAEAEAFAAANVRLATNMLALLDAHRNVCPLWVLSDEFDKTLSKSCLLPDL